ncbi:AI-2E family transporter YdiK [Buchnera aphidicola (Ceratovacuna keduensis)]|uniref:AI-2E family transporter YdiK n=1 Tax=Buchnera aphidicola TaxID=9 RepID=UPI0031B8A393
MKNSKLFMYSKKEIFSLIFIFLLSFLSFLILRPFIFSFIWSCMIVISTWPIMIKIQKIFFNKRYIAIVIMTFFIFIFILVPILFFFNILIYNSKSFIMFLFSEDFKIPDLIFLKNIPFIGKKIFYNYQKLTINNSSNIIKYLQPYIFKLSEFFFEKIGYFSYIIIQLNFILIFNILLFYNGEKFVYVVKSFAIRISYKYGNSILLLIGKSIRAISIVVLITTFVQSLFGWIGLIVSGIPYFSFFSFLIFLCCFLQLGPLPILVPLSIWLFINNNFISGSILTIWSLFICILDNTLKPALIQLGIRLPFFIILFGVIGGLLAFGIIGVFIGPTVLLIMYRLIILYLNKSSKYNFF